MLFRPRDSFATLAKTLSNPQMPQETSYISFVAQRKDVNLLVVRTDELHGNYQEKYTWTQNTKGSRCRTSTYFAWESVEHSARAIPTTATPREGMEHLIGEHDYGSLNPSSPQDRSRKQGLLHSAQDDKHFPTCPTFRSQDHNCNLPHLGMQLL